MATKSLSDQCCFCTSVKDIVKHFFSLPCGHYGCRSCIIRNLNDIKNSGDSKSSKILSCAKCRKEFDHNYLLELRSHLFCSKCQAPAVTFCVTCQKTMCAQHKMEDKTSTASQKLSAHLYVDIDDFLDDEVLYSKHYCRHHQKEIQEVCSSCLRLLCSGCGAASRSCCTAAPDSLTTDISGTASKVRTKTKTASQKLGVLSEEWFKIELKNIEIDNKYLDKMEGLTETVKEVAAQQISAIESKRDDLLTKIKELIIEFGTKNREHCNDIKQHQQEAKRLRAATHKLSTVQSDSGLIEEFSSLKLQVEELLKYKATLLQPPQYQLIETGEKHRDLELQLKEGGPSRLCTAISSPDRKSVLSICYFGKDMIACGGDGFIEVRETANLRVVRSCQVHGYVTCIRQHPTQPNLVTSQFSGSKLIIQLIDYELAVIQKLIELDSRQWITHFSIDSRYLAIISSTTMEVMLFSSKNLRHVRSIPLEGMHMPFAMCLTSDGDHFVLTDGSSNGSCVRKYRIADRLLVWSLHLPNCPTGIVQSAYNELYVACRSATAIYVISDEGEMTRTLDNQQLHPESLVYDVALDNERLFLCHNELKASAITSYKLE